LKPAGPLAVDSEVIDALTQLELPGNARQLENIVRWALANKEDETALNLRDLPLEIWQQLSERKELHCPQAEIIDKKSGLSRPAAEALSQEIPASIVSLLDSNDWNLARALRHCERLLLEAALQKAQGNQSRMARLLGITSRSIYNKLRKHQLQP
jgi:DNA-binding NtrC family response regulator